MPMKCVAQIAIPPKARPDVMMLKRLTLPSARRAAPATDKAVREPIIETAKERATRGSE
jgi:hypothetical protein